MAASTSRSHGDLESVPLASTFEYEERDMTDEILPSYGEALATAKPPEFPHPSPTIGLVDGVEVGRLQPHEQLTLEPRTTQSASRYRPSLNTFGRRPGSLWGALAVFTLIGFAVTIGGVIRCGSSLGVTDSVVFNM
jgi:hypothetical protein